MKCPEGCTCGRHREQRCRPGCTCSRHDAQDARKLSPEAREQSRLRKLQLNREYAARRRATDPAYVEQEKARNRANGWRYWLKHKFGMTIEEWHDRLIDQTGRCYLCEEFLTGVIHIDHDRACCPENRSCGKCIRGLTHQKCNQGIGQFGDDPKRMMKVAANLEAALSRTRTVRE